MKRLEKECKRSNLTNVGRLIECMRCLGRRVDLKGIKKDVKIENDRALTVKKRFWRFEKGKKDESEKGLLKFKSEDVFLFARSCMFLFSLV